MQNDELNKFMDELKDSSISLIKFLYCYCGICDEVIIRNKMSHKDVKIFLPFLKRLDYEEVLKNKDMLYKGNIISVKDSYGNVAPYLNPKIKIVEENNLSSENFLTNKKFDNKLEDAVEKIIVASQLNDYELEKLLKIFKINKRYKEYRVVVRIFKQRKKENKKYKVKKLKGEDIYEYKRK